MKYDILILNLALDISIFFLDNNSVSLWVSFDWICVSWNTSSKEALSPFPSDIAGDHFWTTVKYLQTGFKVRSGLLAC